MLYQSHCCFLLEGVVVLCIADADDHLVSKAAKVAWCASCSCVIMRMALQMPLLGGMLTDDGIAVIAAAILHVDPANHLKVQGSGEEQEFYVADTWISVCGATRPEGAKHPYGFPSHSVS